MAAVFDKGHFVHMTSGDAALQAEIIELFRGQVANWSAAIAQPAQNWRDIVHTLKGSARGIGLMALAEACERAEAEGEARLGDVRAALAEALAALP